MECSSDQLLLGSFSTFTTFAGISGKPWPREKPWSDTPPLEDADGFPDEGAPEAMESDRSGTERVLLADVDASGSSPAFAAARPREANSPADGSSPSGDAPAG